MLDTSNNFFLPHIYNENTKKYGPFLNFMYATLFRIQAENVFNPF